MEIIAAWTLEAAYTYIRKMITNKHIKSKNKQNEGDSKASGVEDLDQN